MDTLLTAVTKVESEISLVENLIHDIHIFDLPEGDLIANVRFGQSIDKDPKLVGGLTATIQEFAGQTEHKSIRSISLQELNILFVQSKKFLIVFVVDPNYPDEQFMGSIFTFVKSFEECITKQDYGKSSIDGAAIAVQTIINLISEEIQMDLHLGKKVTIYPYKLRELANETANQILGSDLKDVEKRLYDDTGSLENVKQAQSPPKNERDALYQVLRQFLATFADASEITLIRTNLDGTFQKYTETRLEGSISSNVYDVVNNMIDTVSVLLDGELEDRIIDLDDELILFQKVTDFSFLYVVMNEKSGTDYIEPILDRISTSLANLFPDDTDV